MTSNVSKAEGAVSRLPAPLVFLRRWAADPRSVGSIAPSGRGLRNLIMRNVRREPDQIVVEFGGGTGGVTRGFLECGVPADKLHTFEIDGVMARYLMEKFPGVHVHHADCRDADKLIPAEDRSRVGSLVLTLPMLVLPMDVQHGVIDVIFRLLPSGGHFLMYTYSLFEPLDAKALGVVGHRMGWTPFNIPPATVWAYRKA